MLRKETPATPDDARQVAAVEEESFTVGFFRPEDAEGITRLFLAVYGDGYPIRFFYDPRAIAAANAEGRCYSLVARTPSGEVIGVTHLYRCASYRFLYEWAAGLVSMEYRNRGVNRRLAAFLHDIFVPMNSDIEELFGEPVCNHPHLQKEVAALRYVETAIEVALMPAEAYHTEHSAAGRVATLSCFRCCKPKPHRIYIPAPYVEEIRWVYAGLDDSRELVVSQQKTPTDRVTHVEMTIFDFAQVARITVRTIGADFAERVKALEAEAEQKGAVVFQVSLNLTEPWVGWAVDILRDRGYFFGGSLPRWFDGDGCLMQKLMCPPDFDAIVLVTDRARHLLEFVRRDWRRAGA
jgi:hypothetical protein